jgi:hypothetical protein
MHDNWPYKYGPPPEDPPANDDGWPMSWLMLAFVIVGPLIYFGPQLRAIETWFVEVYGVIEGALAPIREVFPGNL